MLECALNYSIMHDNHYIYITSTAYTIRGGSFMCSFFLMPVVGGTFLPENPITMLKTMNFNVVIVFFFIKYLHIHICSIKFLGIFPSIGC